MDKKIHLIANAHLDPIWLWRWQEGCGEVQQTFRSALDRLNEYDDFVFTCSSAAYYKWVEDIDPEMFAEIKKMVKRGRWIPVNGWWVQPDCNMPSAESYARQALYSQLYYYEKFGRICKTGYNVDSFGHSAMLPQLIKLGGMDYYVMMRPNKTENGEIPGSLFWWESKDGTRVLTWRIPTGYAEHGKKSLDYTIEKLDEISKETDASGMLFCGVGNHGGGPTKGDIEYLLSKDDAPQELEFTSTDDFFESITANRIDLPTWKDEMQHHASGCYSATSMVKQLNRKAENWLASAEKWNTVAAKTTGMKAMTAELKDAWLKVCFNQFHDILCGCSIKEAYDDVRDSFGYAMTVAANAENNAMLRISKDIDTWLDGVSDSVFFNERHHCENPAFPRPVVVFNPLSHAVSLPVRTYHPSRRVQDCDGKDIAYQNVRSSRSNDSHLDTVFKADVPALGYAVYWLWRWDESKENAFDGKTDVKAYDFTLENEYLKVVFDEKTGAVKSLVTKADGTEYACADNLCLPTVFDNSEPDTWAHNIFKFDKVIDTMKAEKVELVEAGPVRGVIRIHYTYNKSVLICDYILTSGMKNLRVKCKAIWQEPLTIVKIPFPVAGENGVSTYEIPGSFIKRPCNGEEEPALTYGDLTADGKGITVYSDSKYSYSCPENELRLTVIRNSIFADHYSDRPAANFDYCDEGLQRFEYCVEPHTGGLCPAKAAANGEEFNVRPVTVPVSYHKGTLPLKKSYITVDTPCVTVDSIKLCEDGSGDGIIRARETSGKETRAMIKCDMFDCAFYADFNPNEIKTFRIDAEGYVKQTNFLEGIVED